MSIFFASSFDHPVTPLQGWSVFRAGIVAGRNVNGCAMGYPNAMEANGTFAATTVFGLAINTGAHQNQVLKILDNSTGFGGLFSMDYYGDGRVYVSQGMNNVGGSQTPI